MSFSKLIPLSLSIFGLACAQVGDIDAQKNHLQGPEITELSYDLIQDKKVKEFRVIIFNEDTDAGEWAQIFAQADNLNRITQENQEISSQKQQLEAGHEVAKPYEKCLGANDLGGCLDTVLLSNATVQSETYASILEHDSVYFLQWSKGEECRITADRLTCKHQDQVVVLSKNVSSVISTQPVLNQPTELVVAEDTVNDTADPQSGEPTETEGTEGEEDDEESDEDVWGDDDGWGDDWGDDDWGDDSDEPVVANVSFSGSNLSEDQSISQPDRENLEAGRAKVIEAKVTGETESPLAGGLPHVSGALKIVESDLTKTIKRDQQVQFVLKSVKDLYGEFEITVNLQVEEVTESEIILSGDAIPSDQSQFIKNGQVCPHYRYGNARLVLEK